MERAKDELTCAHHVERAGKTQPLRMRSPFVLSLRCCRTVSRPRCASIELGELNARHCFERLRHLVQAEELSALLGALVRHERARFSSRIARAASAALAGALRADALGAQPL
jgi:hypothetical protein